MTRSKPVVLVIDSGVGGLSICQSILSAEPELQLVYFADDAYFPYGTLPEEVLSERLRLIVAEMLRRHQPDLVVLACNTVSTLLLPELRERFHVPFVGVVPAIKPAAAASLSRHIGLLATPATVDRDYTEDLIREFAADCQVSKIGSSALVREAEKLLTEGDVDLKVIEAVLAPFKTSHRSAITPSGVSASTQPNVDTVVLGCTHFPLLREQLAHILPAAIWVDSGQAIARRVSHLLAREGSVADSDGLAVGDEPADDTGKDGQDSPCHQLYFSKQVPQSACFRLSLARMGLRTVSMQQVSPAA